MKSTMCEILTLQGVPEKSWFLNFPADVPFGPLWAIWATLGHSGPLWATLGHFGLLWATWATLGHFAHSGPFGPLWATFGHLGHFGFLFFGGFGVFGFSPDELSIQF